MPSSAVAPANQPSVPAFEGTQPSASGEGTAPQPGAPEFERLMRDHNQRLFRIARSIVKNDADAEDVVQLAYLCAYCRWEQLTKKENVRAWLNRIVCNQALDRLRKNSRLESRLLDAPLEEPPDPATTKPNPEDEALGAELRHLLERAIERLPVELSSVLVMRDVQGMSSLEVGQALGVGEGAVRVRLHRARKTVREWLGRRVEEHWEQAYAFAGERCDRIVADTLEASGDSTLPARRAEIRAALDTAEQSPVTRAHSDRLRRGLWLALALGLLVLALGLVIFR